MTERHAIFFFTKGDVLWYKNNHQTLVKKKKKNLKIHTKVKDAMSHKR